MKPNQAGELNEVARERGLTPEMLLRRILADVSDALVVIDDTQRILLFNRAAEEAFGYDSEEVLGSPLTVLLPERFRLGHASHVKGFAGDPAERQLMSERPELVGRCKDGSEFPIEVTISKLYGGSRMLFTALVRDITDRIALQEQRDLVSRRFEAMVQSASDAIVVMDLQGHALYVSPSYVGLLGYNLEERQAVLGSSLIHPDQLARYKRTLDKVLALPDAVERGEFLLHHRDGRWRWLDVAFTNLLDKSDVGGIVINARDITERKDAEVALKYQAGHDLLTGLPNRALLAERLRRELLDSKQKSCEVAVLFVDLDRFKVVNDSLGHSCGDDLLISVAARIKALVREGDLVARLGGDEFVVLCPCSNGKQAQALARRLLNSIIPSVQLSGTDVFVTASVGIAVTNNADISPEWLLADADMAMYEAKRRGGNSFQVFDPLMRQRSIERVTIEAELRHGLENGEVQPYFQPIVDLSNGEILGYEALARWEHPKRGTVTPDAFIPVAEETGLIMVLGSHILMAACTEVHQSNLQARTSKGIAVNVSVKQLENTTLLESVDMALRISGLPAELLTLEITENLFMADIASILPLLNEIRSLGVRLAIDDFGVGYSSLSYLRQLPVSTIKIDRSFITSLDSDVDARSIVHALVPMAHALGLTVIAEGVETESHARILSELGCDFAQGYLFGRPSRLGVSSNIDLRYAAVRPKSLVRDMGGRARTKSQR